MKLQRNMELFETELLRLRLIRTEIKLLLMFACLYKSSTLIKQQIGMKTKFMFMTHHRRLFIGDVFFFY